MPKENLQNRTFGRLTALQDTGNSERGSAVWECICSCGNLITVPARRLKVGKTRSCGCLNAEVAGARLRTHGKTKTTEYHIWGNMIQRCGDENSNSFPRYGGRGIAVCERWKSFENFLSDMGRRPHADWQLDRIDNEQGYSKENCRWTTRLQQARNRRSNICVEIQGKQMILKDACALLGIPYGRVQARRKRGRTTEEALELV